MPMGAAMRTERSPLRPICPCTRSPSVCYAPAMIRARQFTAAIEGLVFAFALAAFAWLTPSPALAHHDTVSTGGSAPVYLLILLGIAVVVLFVFLSRWQPSKGGHKRPRARRRPTGKKSNRR